MRRSLYWLCVLGCGVAGVYCFFSALTVAWLGSFPDRDVHAYTVRFYLWLLTSVAFVGIAGYVAFRFRAPPSPAPSVAPREG
jgi:Na+-driven multidrug efflux pump